MIYISIYLMLVIDLVMEIFKGENYTSRWRVILLVISSTIPNFNITFTMKTSQ
jgi:O-antigen/teichoic acid export membrane protein